MKKFREKLVRWILRLVILFFVSSIFFVVLYRFIPVPCTPLMLTRLVDQTQAGKSLKLKKDWVSLDNISSKLPLAVLASEDQKFLAHNGFDFDAMKKAFEGNRKGKKIKGGSTITQQVAKNVFLWQGRSYIRKGLEAYFTCLIELVWPKKRIMEVYLNVIEMGNGVYGAEAAAHYYFAKNAQDLNQNEAAWIACILPCPLKYDPKNPTAYLRKRQLHTKTQMRYIGSLKWDQ